MPHLSVFETYQFMSNKNIFFAYTGTFDHFTITSLLKGIKSKLKVLEIEKIIAQKIQNILVLDLLTIKKKIILKKTIIIFKMS